MVNQEQLQLKSARDERNPKLKPIAIKKKTPRLMT
eukprot:CAMPEP_0170560088 /NCGR_PEP_ID=MMETSP0211-20121228/46983_1 /TAXON_ID=311385 /ORGANISM="Pseudokeronopsis sp., Strain OXSARD2" /LENGTH=34 /DNA_ID= /DNA_START= /DNA_END= /DNA_ORIENTATION=